MPKLLLPSRSVTQLPCKSRFQRLRIRTLGFAWMKSGSKVHPPWRGTISLQLLVISALLSQPTWAAPRFGAPSTYQVDGSPVRVVPTDVDKQTGLDLVTGNDSGPSLSIMLNRGLGSFFPEIRKGLSASRFILHDIDAGDFNGDGAGDLAVAVDDITVFPIRTNVLVYLNLNDGSGQFAAPQQYPLNGLFPQCVQAGDVTGDGVLDLVVCHSTLDTGSGVITVLKGQGTASAPTGLFDSGVDFAVGSGPANAAIADVDRDGHPDVVVGDPNEKKVYMLYGNGGAGLLNPAVSLADVDAPSAVAVKQDATDAFPVVLVTSLTTGQLVSLRQTTPRTFASATLSVGQGLLDLGVADFDGDGFSDVVLLSDRQLGLWYGTNTTAFTFGEAVALDPMETSVAVADLNGDGKPDVATTSGSADLLTVVLNGANAPATPTLTPTLTPLPHTPTFTPTQPPVTPPTSTASPTSTPTASPSPSLAASATATPTPAGPGDANCDGRFDPADLNAVISEIFAPQCAAADANGDRSVSAADVPRIIDLVGGF